MRPVRLTLLCALLAGCAAPQSTAPPPRSAASGRLHPSRGSMPMSETVVTTGSASSSIESFDGAPDDVLRFPTRPPPPAPAEPAAAPTPEAPSRPAPIVQPTAQPVPMRPGSAAGGAPVFAPPPGRDEARDATIAGLASAIVNERARIAVALAGLVECREVCEASGGICRAASQICRLTGDEGLDAATARDGRCARALQACTEAGQLRDGRCPRCPAPP